VLLLLLLAGSNFWDTPMSRHLFEGSNGTSSLELPVSPRSSKPGSPAVTLGDGKPEQMKQESHMYMALLRLPLRGVLRYFWGGVLGRKQQQ
jgi:hypothetical protein